MWLLIWLHQLFIFTLRLTRNSNLTISTNVTSFAILTNQTRTSDSNLNPNPNPIFNEDPDFNPIFNEDPDFNPFFNEDPDFHPNLSFSVCAACLTLLLALTNSTPSPN